MENKNYFKEYMIAGKKYKLHLFDKINTKEEAYLIGYMLGDGGFQRGTYKRKHRMFICSSDEYIIEYFKKKFQPKNSINRHIPVNEQRPEIKSTRHSSRMTFSSKFTPTFKKFGILGLKEDRTYHNIPKKYMRHFLLGLIDADGFITWGKRKDRDRLWTTFGITHPSLKMLEKLQRFLLEELEIPTSINPKGKENCYVLRTGSLRMVERIIDYIYEDKPEMYIKRKYKNCIDFKNEFKNYKFDKEKSIRQTKI